MKVRVSDIMSGQTCDVWRATMRVIHMRMNDAFAITFILRKLIECAYYDPSNQELSIDRSFVVRHVVYEDIATLTKLMDVKPCNRSYKGFDVIANRIYENLVKMADEENKKGGDQ